MSRASDGTIPPILCYHKIDTRLELGFTRLGPRAFQKQIEGLARAGYRGIGSEELLASLSAPFTAHRSPLTVVITFDDGYTGLADYAFPILADHGFKALVFAITDYVGRENTWDIQYGWRRFYHMDWDELGRWQERGMEVHSHGLTHARLTWLPDNEVLDELTRAREVIAARLGGAPMAISYPFGASDARVRGLAERAGHRLGFTGPANADAAADPLMLPRLPVYPWDFGGPPFVMQRSGMGGLARGAAWLTNRCAVGTAAFQKLLGRRY